MKKKQKGPDYTEEERQEMLDLTSLSYELSGGSERKRSKNKSK